MRLSRNAIAALAIWTCLVVVGLGIVSVSTDVRGVANNYPRAIANVLVHEGGNDDDPRDPGGRTSRGILQREWDKYRDEHPGLPEDVWEAPQADVLAIYRTKYADHPCVNFDRLPYGIDYLVFDFGINAGVDRGGKTLRRSLRLPDSSCRVTDEVIAAVHRKGLVDTIHDYGDARIAFYKNLRTCKYFCKGWLARERQSRNVALSMAGVHSALPMELPDYDPSGALKAYDSPSDLKAPGDVP
jgi:lysozyme family protein